MRTTTRSILGSFLAIALVVGAVVAYGVWPAQEADALYPGDYELEYVETLEHADGPFDGQHVGGARQSWSPDGQWIYYGKPQVIQGSSGLEYPDYYFYPKNFCPKADLEDQVATNYDCWDVPDRVYRIHPDGTGDQCVTCNVFGTEQVLRYNWADPGNHYMGPRPLWVSSPQVRPGLSQNYLLTVLERNAHEYIPLGTQCPSSGGFFWTYSDVTVFPIVGGNVDQVNYTRLTSVNGTDRVDNDDFPNPDTTERYAGFSGDPRWSEDGSFVVWTDNRAMETTTSDDPWLRVGYLHTTSPPDLHDVNWNESLGRIVDSGVHGSLGQTYDPSWLGPYVTGGFTYNASGGVTGVYHGSPPEVLQHWYNDDLAVLSFDDKPGPVAQVRLTHSKGSGGEPANYEEHARLNTKYWDVMSYMSGPAPSTTFPCFYDGFAPNNPGAVVGGLRTDLWLMDPILGDLGTTPRQPRQVSYYNNGQTWDMDPEWNPSDCRELETWETGYIPVGSPGYPAKTFCRVIVVKQWWAPNGTDLIVSLAKVVDEDINNALDPDPTKSDYQWSLEGAFKIFHFKRWHSPAANTSNSVSPCVGGTNPGFEVNPSKAHDDGPTGSANAAQNIGTSSYTALNQCHEFSNLGISVPENAIEQGKTVTVDRIEVRLDGWSDATGGFPRYQVQLWDKSANEGAGAWTTGSDVGVKVTTILDTEDNEGDGDSPTRILGSGTNPTWGATWTVNGTTNELADGLFKIRVASVCTTQSTCTSQQRDWYLDWVSVRVSYTVT